MAAPRLRVAPSMLVVSTVLALAAAAVTYVVLADRFDSGSAGDQVIRLEPGGGGSGEGVEATPNGELTGLTFQELGGTTTDLAELRGTPAVINFFGSWCAPCRLEMPELERVHQDLAGEVTFLGLAVRDRPEDVRSVVADTGVTYRVGRDVDDRVLLAVGGGQMMPATAFVDAGGTVVHVHLGELDEAGIRSRIAEHLGVRS